MEKEINQLLEDCTRMKLTGILLCYVGQYLDALEKAKEVTNK